MGFGLQNTPASSAAAKKKTGVSNGDHLLAGDVPYTAWRPRPEPRSDARETDALQTSTDPVQDARVSVADGVARSLGPRGAGALGKDVVVHVSPVTKWPNVGPNPAFGASGGRQV